MTERLYYTDPYLREFDATVARRDVDTTDAARAACSTAPRSIRPPAASRSTPARSGDARVVDVVDDEDGDVAARRRSRPAVGDGVHGAIDWARRFDHMQQHTGQHVLSAAFDRLLERRAP